MPFSLLPRIITKELTDLTPELLRQRNVRLLMLDFDNTIVPYTTDTPTGKMDTWLKMINASDIRVCVVSNSRSDRVPRFCARYGMPCILRSRKPFPKGIRECLKRFDIPADRAALVGDQIFTDTLGGNCAGVTTVLVEAIHNHNLWLKARHVLEKPFIYLARKRRLTT